MGYRHHLARDHAFFLFIYLFIYLLIYLFFSHMMHSDLNLILSSSMSLSNPLFPTYPLLLSFSSEKSRAPSDINPTWYNKML